MTYKGTDERLRRILDTVAESVAEATDAEILEDVKAQGKNPAVVAQEVRTVLLRSVIAHGKTKLRAAQIQHEQQVVALRRIRFSLPDTPAAMRALLAKVLTLVPEYETALLTAQYRGFSELSDEDVRQHLVQLAQLGVLEDPKLREGGN